ncbi:hypothetical protein, partial [Rhizobium ruizarguesonis]|uniref:hypothetical protein n=1 Tax=Rhizobium ruizarguesonis TaxID=2081791 RepID=UPI001A8CF06C
EPKAKGREPVRHPRHQAGRAQPGNRSSESIAATNALSPKRRAGSRCVILGIKPVGRSPAIDPVNRLQQRTP